MASLPYPRRPPNSFHRTHSKFVCASPPTEFTEYTEVSGGGYSPTDFTEYTEASGGEEPPTDFTDVHRFFFSASRFCVFREFCGKIVLWLRGVWHSCHTHAALQIPSTEPIPSLFAQVFPQNSQNTQKFLAEDILPRNSQNTQKFLAEDILPQIAQNTQKLLAENSLPQMRTDAHRWLGCAGFSHGIHRIHRSFWRRIFSHGFHRCTQIFLLRQSFLCVP